MVGREVCEEFPPRARRRRARRVLEVDAAGRAAAFHGRVAHGAARARSWAWPASSAPGARRWRWPSSARSRRRELSASTAASRVPLAGRGDRARASPTSPRTARARGLFPLLGLGANITITHLASAVRPAACCRRAARPAQRRRGAVRDFDVRAAGLDTAGGHAVRRQPAEGAARALPRRAAARAHPRRAHARRRRRRAGGDLPRMNRLTAQRARHPDDLVGPAGDPRHVGPRGRHARGPNDGELTRAEATAGARDGAGGGRGMTLRHGLSRYAIFVALAARVPHRRPHHRHVLHGREPVERPAPERVHRDPRRRA